jgi:hypothetical protein
MYRVLAVIALATIACGPERPPAERTDVEPAARAFRAKFALNPIVVDGDPYAPAAQPAAASTDRAVCAVRYEGDRVRYRLQTMPDADAARRDGYIVTHLGACGTCSTLHDLAVYLSRPDLTMPVRRCTAFGLTRARTLACLRELGFSEACAATWYYDAMNTRRECGWVCMVSWLSREPSNHPDGRLNDCLQCDEDRSGPIFKRVAGRTRRNSGIRSSIDRHDGEVASLVHDYY